MKNGPSVPPALAAVLIVVLIGIIGVLAYRNFVPAHADGSESLGGKADLSKLTPEQLQDVKRNFEAAKASRGTTAN